MIEHELDITPVIDLTSERGAGPVRVQRPAYLDHLPPCNVACPAGEDIQGWLSFAQAGDFKAAWERLVTDNPLPSVHGRVCYHPCETSCNRVHGANRLGSNSLLESLVFSQAAAKVITQDVPSVPWEPVEADLKAYHPEELPEKYKRVILDEIKRRDGKFYEQWCNDED